jgi:hypothetical protein
LLQAPPKGIHHHFCRLAVVTFPNPPSDCRHLWPPDFGGEGCCTCSVCVTADSHNQGTLTIQQAIDQVKTTGGTVCLGVGTYFLPETASIVGAKNLSVRGQGSATVLTFSAAGPAILVDASNGVILEEFALLAAPREQVGNPAVALHNNSAATVQRCAIVNFAFGGNPATAIGLSGVLSGVLVRENFLAAQIGIGRAAAASGGLSVADFASTTAVLTADLVVQDNIFECLLRGVNFDALSLHSFQTRLSRNLIAGCSQSGFNMLGWVVPGSGLDVCENELHITGAGIVVGTDDARIESNNIAPLLSGQGTDGIILTLGFDKTGLDRCQVLNNRVVGMAGNGIHVQSCIVHSAMIKSNYVDAVGGSGFLMDDTSTAEQLTVENNHLFNLAPLSNDANTPIIGLRVVNTIRAEIVGNALVNVGIAAAQNPHRAGIQVVNIGSGRIDGNSVLNLGPAGDFLQDAVGIESLGTFVRLDVTNNSVRRNEVFPIDPGTSQWFAIRIQTLSATGFLAVSSNLSFVVAEDLIYALIGNRLVPLPRGREIVGLQGNLLESYGTAPAVRVVARGALTLSTNRCLLGTAAANAAFIPPVVEGDAGAVLANTNYLEGATKIPAMVLNLLSQNGPFTVLGNISSGEIQINGTALAAPWAALNVIA